MYRQFARDILPVAVMVSTFGVLLQVLLFGRALLEALDPAGDAVFACIALLPGILLAPAMRRWSGAIFVAGNAAMFGSGWLTILLVANQGLPGHVSLAVPLGVFLAGAVLVMGTGLQYCGHVVLGAPLPAQRAALIVIATSLCTVIFPLVKIELEFTAYFALGCIACSVNLLLFGISGGQGNDSLEGDQGSLPSAPAKKGAGGILTLVVAILSLLIAHASYYLGQTTIYAAERTVWVWPGAALAGGLYLVARKYTTKSFRPLLAPVAAFACVGLAMAGAPWGYGWEHALLVGCTYAFVLLSFLEVVPRWSPSNPRWVGLFFGVVGWFTVVCLVIVGYGGGIPSYSSDIPPVLVIMVYCCVGLVFAGMLQIYLFNSLARRSEST